MIICIFYNQINQKTIATILLLSILLIPLSGKALKEISITAHTNIEISNTKKYCIVKSYEQLYCDVFENKTEYYDYVPGQKVSSIPNLFNDNLGLNDLKEYGFTDYEGNKININENDEILSFENGCYLQLKTGLC